MSHLSNVLIIDAETSALPESERNLFRPEFEHNRSLKDPEKIKADLANKEADWNSRSALSALTGKILCVGCWTEKKGVFVIESSDECDIVQSALDLLQSTIQSGGSVVGHYIRAFDLPFLCQRAWRMGIYVPKCLRNGKWWADEIIDLADLWTGPGSKDRISLDHLAKALGVGAKNGDGADFGKLWIEDKPKALLYVRNDIELIRLCADIML